MDDQERELAELERILIGESSVPTRLSYAAIKSITHNFSEEQVIGRGGFGVVYKGTLQNGKVAIKKLSIGLDLDDTKFWQEINCLVRVKHKNVVRFLGYCAETQAEFMEVSSGKYIPVDLRQRMLCFEYVRNGSLDRYLAGNANALDWNRCYRIIKGMCAGLHYLHQQHINHLDLKPQNVLLDIHMEPKITDFGLSRLLVEKSKTYTENICGTLGYVAPEMINDKVISYKSDIYSLGIMMAELIAGRNMHDTANRSSDIEHVQLTKCSEIAQSCIDEDKNKRPTIVEIIHILQEIEIPNEKVILVDEPGDQGSSIDQIWPDASKDELLDVHPSILHFPLEPNKSSRPFSLHLTNNSAEDSVAFMFVDSGVAVSSSLLRSGVIPPQSTWGIVLHLELKKGEEQAIPDKRCKDMVLVRSTIVSKGFSADDITADMFNNQTCVHDIALQIIFIEPSHPQPNLLPEFDKLQLGADGETARGITQACPGSINTELLEIYPLELRFPPRAPRHFCRTINLTNKTDEEITFWIVPSDPARYWTTWKPGSFVKNTVPSQSTCAASFSIQIEKYRAEKVESFDILMVTSRSVCNVSLRNNPDVFFDQVFKAVREKGGRAHRALLFVANNGPELLRRQNKEELIEASHFQKMTSIDVHPNEPLVLTGHERHVCVWIRSIQKKHVLHKAKGLSDATDFVVKFIPRKQQVLSGDSSGKIKVYTTKLDLLHTFTAHGGRVRSLAVHPSHSYVLSSSDDLLIKLWDWDNAWTCIREFCGHLDPVTHVVFNPMDSNTFASVSCLSSTGPGNVKIWSIDDATDPKIDLYGGFNTVDWSAKLNDRQYLVAAMEKGITELWDLETERCVKTIKDRNATTINGTLKVVCHPTLPLIFTGTSNGSVAIWNITTCRMVCWFKYIYGEIIGIRLSEMDGYKRLMIGHETKVNPMEIDLQTLAGLY